MRRHLPQRNGICNQLRVTSNASSQIASFLLVRVTTGNLVIRGTLSGRVGEALTVSLALLDALGNVVPNPNERFTAVRYPPIHSLVFR